MKQGIHLTAKQAIVSSLTCSLLVWGGQLGYIVCPLSARGDSDFLQDPNSPLVVTCKPANPNVQDKYGEAVARRGELMIVGAPGTDKELGACYFTWNDALALGNGWHHAKNGALQPPIVKYQQFGRTVALSDELAIVGGLVDPGTLNRGAAWAYSVRIKSAPPGGSLDYEFTKTGIILPPDCTQDFATQNRLCILNASEVVASDPQATTSIGGQRGAVYHCHRPAGATEDDPWKCDKLGIPQLQGFTLTDFGTTIASSDDWLFIAAKFANSKLERFASGWPLTDGLVLVYSRTNGSFEFNQVLPLQNQTGVGLYFGFGNSLASGKSNVFIGVPDYKPSPNQPSTGRVVAYVLGPDSRWVFDQMLDAGSVDTSFGSAIACDEKHVFVGAPGKTYNKGAILIFSRPSYDPVGQLSAPATSTPPDPHAGRIGVSFAADQGAVICGLDSSVASQNKTNAWSNFVLFGQRGRSYWQQNSTAWQGSDWFGKTQPTNQDDVFIPGVKDLQISNAVAREVSLTSGAHLTITAGTQAAKLTCQKMVLHSGSFLEMRRQAEIEVQGRLEFNSQSWVQLGEDCSITAGQIRFSADCHTQIDKASLVLTATGTVYLSGDLKVAGPIPSSIDNVILIKGSQRIGEFSPNSEAPKDFAIQYDGTSVFLQRITPK